MSTNLNGVKPQRHALSLPCEFHQQKCLNSSFDPVVAHPQPKRWRTVKKLTQEALIEKG